MFKVKFSKPALIVLSGIVCYFVALVTIALQTKGTCDSGDSIIHFLFSRYAFLHPENFLDHWAKPLFVLLSAPFAQFGFAGMKIFNCSIAALTAWYCYRAAMAANFKNAWFAPVLLCFAPGYLVHIFSGLTEPLFGLLLIVGIYLILSQRLPAALCIVSFLPFVRSEGLIIICVFALYLIVAKQFKFVPWLLLGHLVYSIVGCFYYKDILWVFSKIPYAGSSGKYGSGGLLHFVVQLNYIIGIPLYILVISGLLKKLKELLSSNSIYHYTATAEALLIYGVFVAFLGAHSLFWYFGIFESMGLKRVLIAVVPVAVLVALHGYNFIIALFKSKVVNTIVAIAFAAWVIVFPFVPNPASVNWQRDFSLSAEQALAEEVTAYLKENFPEDLPVYYAHPYLHITLNKDPFDEKFKKLNDLFDKQRPLDCLVVWDSWFSKTENGITLERLQADPDLVHLKTFETNDKGKAVQFIVFENKRSH